MPDSFSHLHVHTEYSMLDGASRVAAIVAKAAADGQPAVGITDHGVLYGLPLFYQLCVKHGINPVLGAELYMADDRFTHPARRSKKQDDTGGDTDSGGKLYYHLTVLAENEVGYRNLIQLATRAYLEGYWYKPRCLLAGQEIVTATGMKRIEDVAIGDLVMTHRGRLRPVTQVMSREFDGTIYGVELNNRYNRVTWMTGEHPVLVRDQDGTVRWVEVQNINAGRRVKRNQMSSWNSFACLPKVRPDRRIRSISTPKFVGGGWTHNGERFVKESMRSKRGATRHYNDLAAEVDLDYDFGFFVGLYAAEGSANRKTSVRFDLHEDEIDLIDACRRVVKRLTGKDVSLLSRGADYHGAGVIVHSAPLAHLMSALCGNGANSKHLPDFVFAATKEFQRGVLDGVLAGDGSSDRVFSTFTQTSENLAWQVRALAATFADAFPSVAERHDGDENHAPQFRMHVPRPDAVTYRRTLADDEYVYRPISEVHTKEYTGQVFNIEVADDHSYVSDFAIHNCDWDLLEQYSEGLIVTTGCLGGMTLQALVPSHIMDPDKNVGDPFTEQQRFDKALGVAGRLQDIFGRDNLFVELQDHGIPAQTWSNPRLLDIARRLNAPILGTNDSHYTEQHDHAAHDALLCVQTGSKVSDENRLKFHGDQHYFKTAAEMRYLFREVPAACDNTLWIAERAHVDIADPSPKLPQFPVPDDEHGHPRSPEQYLTELVWEGAVRRWGDPLSKEHVDRLTFELDVIHSMGFDSYFLIVWDLIRYAHECGVRTGPGRGSAAGCAVAYCLGITEIDPIKYDLLFERFLNPSRISMPDIDLDIDSRFREAWLDYARQKYGSDRVCQIITFSEIKARAAVRDAARVLDKPYAVGDRIAKAVPEPIMGRSTPIPACLEKDDKYAEGFAAAAELRAMYATDPEAKEVIDVAMGLEGMRRQDGIHAAAVVISDRPLTDILPLQRKPEAGQDPEDAPIVTQYEMGPVENLGLLKMDFLALRNLDVITDTVDLVRKVHGIEVPIDNPPLDDPKTFALLQRADTAGIFQLESDGVQDLIKRMKPSTFEDIGALVALYRPGPMKSNMHTDYADRKNGRKAAVALHPDADDLLRDTYSLMIYQEQMMRVAQHFAGYSLADADLLRKACGKKVREIMQKERAKFVAGCVATGYGEEVGTQWFDQIEPFADYSFNKCLAAGTRVHLADGTTVPIETLVDVEPGVHQVIGWVGNKPTPVGLVTVYNNGRQPTHTVTLANGYTITATNNHRHRTTTGWKTVAAIAPGDELCVVDPDGNPATSAVVAVNSAGQQPTYDVEVDHPSHAYVANGVVTHNSHAFGYAYVAYQTLYLKANWPNEYMAALLTSVMDKQEKTAPLLHDCRRMGITVLPPDVNRSEVGFTVAPGTDTDWVVVFGMAGIRNVGSALVGLLIAEREKNGPFADFFDFCDRVDPAVLNKRAVESLISAGAFDSFGYTRKGLVDVHSQVIDQAVSRRKTEAAGQYDLFSSLGSDTGSDSPAIDVRVPIPTDEYDRKTRLALERDMLGVYVSDHPLAGMERRLSRYGNCLVSELDAKPLGTTVKVAGMVTNIEWKVTKNSSQMCLFTIEDLSGTSPTVVAFTKTVNEHRDKIIDGRVVVVTCRVDDRGGNRQLVVSELMDLPGGADQTDVILYITVADVDEFLGLAPAFKDSMAAFPGDSPVRIRMPDGVLQLGPDYRVSPESGLIAELKAMFGAAAVTVE